MLLPATAAAAAHVSLLPHSRAPIAEFATFCNTSTFLQALREMNGFWAAMVQSGAPLPLPKSNHLAGRSCDAVLAVTCVWTTVVLLIGYLSYTSLWSDMRVWLAGKAQGAASTRGSSVVMIEGVAVTVEQLQRMCHSPYSLLLSARGGTGWLAQVLLHCGIINLICLGAWLLAHTLVQQLMPALLPGRVLDLYCQMSPQVLPSDCMAAGVGMCTA